MIQTLTHKSANQNKNNEKLEFLGDRVIGIVLSKKLFDLYPNESEGVLDKRFAKLVNRKTCALIAWNVGLGDFIVTGNIKRNISLIIKICDGTILNRIKVLGGKISFKRFKRIR